MVSALWACPVDRYMFGWRLGWIVPGYPFWLRLGTDLGPMARLGECRILRMSLDRPASNYMRCVRISGAALIAKDVGFSCTTLQPQRFTWPAVWALENGSGVRESLALGLVSGPSSPRAWHPFTGLFRSQLLRHGVLLQQVAKLKRLRMIGVCLRLEQTKQQARAYSCWSVCVI